MQKGAGKLLRSGFSEAEIRSALDISGVPEIISCAPRTVAETVAELKKSSHESVMSILTETLGIKKFNPDTVKNTIDRLSEIYAFGLLLWDPEIIKSLRVMNNLSKKDNQDVLDEWIRTCINESVLDAAGNDSTHLNNLLKIVSHLKADETVLIALGMYGKDLEAFVKDRIAKAIANQGLVDSNGRAFQLEEIFKFMKEGLGKNPALS